MPDPPENQRYYQRNFDDLRQKALLKVAEITKREAAQIRGNFFMVKGKLYKLANLDKNKRNNWLTSYGAGQKDGIGWLWTANSR